MSINPLRNLPSVQDLLENPRLKSLMDRISQSSIVATGRAVLDEVHREFQAAAADHSLPSVSELAERIARRVTERPGAALRPVVNATGIILHSELGRPPLADEAIAEIEAIASSYSLLGQGESPAADAPFPAEAESLLQKLSGAEAALVVNNNAAGLLLTLTSLASGREVLVSRSQLINAGGDCPMSELIAASGAHLREIGATNKTTIDDYADAIHEQTGVILVVQTGHVTGATAMDATLGQLADLSRRTKVPLIHNLGLGAMVDLKPFGLDVGLSVLDSVRSGADVTLFSGDKLLGAPACGIVLGKHSLLEKIEHHPTMRVLRVGRAIRAGLTAALRLYGDAERVRFRVPVLALLGTSVDNLRNRAERLMPQIAAQPGVQSAEVVADVAFLTSEQLASQQLPTCCVAVRPRTRSADDLAAALRSGPTAVAGKVRDDRVLLDLRTVLPCQDALLVEAFESLAERPG